MKMGMASRRRPDATRTPLPCHVLQLIYNILIKPVAYTRILQWFIGRFPCFVFEPFTVAGAFSMPVEANPDTTGGPIESQWDLRRYPGQPRQNWFSCHWCSKKVSIRIKGNWVSICGLENGEPGTMICVHQWGNRKMYNTWQYLEISVKAASR